ncbi:hypothetical protein F4556_005880 [Kitasatospora gansuensis]|uniref:Uncharacterized protein n=1 Tax=Kitasatospora gansuensis TaxID=258050 RepID=A0A7W7SH21_9ACTN|nr:hypothetical protein [Kitasatospora gansuensis]MBB4950345.1 hypothetical protein [Kitasatospora gansuensis]
MLLPMKVLPDGLAAMLGVALADGVGEAAVVAGADGVDETAAVAGAASVGVLAATFPACGGTPQPATTASRVADTAPANVKRHGRRGCGAGIAEPSFDRVSRSDDLQWSGSPERLPPRADFFDRRNDGQDRSVVVNRGMHWMRAFHHPGDAAAIGLNRRLGFVEADVPVRDDGSGLAAIPGRAAG